MHVQKDIHCNLGGCKPCWRSLGGERPLQSTQGAGTSRCQPPGWSAPCLCSGPLLQSCSAQNPTQRNMRSLTYTVHMLWGSFVHLDCVFPWVQIVTRSCAPGEKLDVKSLMQCSAASCWRTRLSITHLKLDSHQHNADMLVWTGLYPAGKNSDKNHTIW